MSAMGHSLPSQLAPESNNVRFGPKADKRARGWIVR